MRNRTDEEVEQQERDAARRSRRACWLALALLLFGGQVAWAQQVGGSHQMADLFKVFFSWSANDVTLLNDRGLVLGNVVLAITHGADSNRTSFPSGFFFDGSGAQLRSSTGFRGDNPSGSNVYSVNSASGARYDFGGGSDDFCTSNGTYITCGVSSGGYIASQNTRIVPVYVNNVIGAFTYGGDVLDARAATVNAIRFHVRTSAISGDGGISGTNTNFRIQDSAGAFCNCAFNCYQVNDGGATGGSMRVVCSGDAGTGCAFPASAIRAYSFSAVGDCATPIDISGNLEIEEVPQ